MARIPRVGNGRNVAVAVSLGQELLDIALLTFGLFCSRCCPRLSPLSECFN
jgi:hypothetical protein